MRGLLLLTNAINARAYLGVGIGGNGTNGVTFRSAVSEIYTNFNLDPFIYVGGYYGEGDGGGGVFVLTNTVTSTNRGTRFEVVGAAKSYERVHDGNIDVRWFGAKGSADDGPMIQAAVDYCEANNFTLAIPPTVDFTINSVVNLKDNTRLIGDGGRITVGDIDVGLSVSGKTNVTISGIKFSGAYTRAIQVLTSSNIVVRGCEFTGATRIPVSGYIAGLRVDSSAHIKILDNWFHGNGNVSTNFDNSVDLLIGGGTSETHDVEIRGNRVESKFTRISIGAFCPVDGIIAGNWVDGGNCLGLAQNNGYGIMIYGTPGLTYRNQIVGNFVTNTAGSGIYVRYANGTIVKDNSVTDSAKQQDDTSLPVAAIVINLSYGAVVSGNSITNATKSGLTICDSTNVIANANIFQGVANRPAIEVRGIMDNGTISDNSVSLSLRGIASTIGGGVFKNVSLRGNSISNITDGIYLEKSTNTTVALNQLFNTANIAIYNAAGTNAIISLNTIINSGSTNYGTGIRNDGAKTTITFNTIVGAETQVSNSDNNTAILSGPTGGPLGFNVDGNTRFTGTSNATQYALQILQSAPAPNQYFLQMGALGETNLSGNPFSFTRDGDGFYVLELNGLGYYFPRTNSTGILANNGSGLLDWIPAPVGGGTGTVTSITATNGVEAVSGSPITASGTLRATEFRRIEGDATSTVDYTFTAADRGMLIAFNSESPMTATLPAGGSIMPAGWYVDAKAENANGVTILPALTTFLDYVTNGIVLVSDQSVRIVSSGTYYYSIRGLTTAASTATGQALNFGEQFEVGSLTNIAFGADRSITNLILVGNTRVRSVNLGSVTGAFNVDGSLSSEITLQLDGNATMGITNFTDDHNIFLLVTNSGSFALTITNDCYWTATGDSAQQTNDWGAGKKTVFSFSKKGGAIIAGKDGLQSFSNWRDSGTTNAFLVGNSTVNSLVATNGVTPKDVTASSLVRTDGSQKLAPVTIGSGIAFDGTTLTGTGSGHWIDSGTTNAFLVGNATLNALTVTNGVTTKDVTASSIVRTDSAQKLAPLTVGAGLTFDGTTISSTSDNWLDSGTTNGFLIGNATVNALTVTNGVTAKDVTASKLLRTDSAQKLAPVTIGAGITFDGTTLSAANENWLASGTTNAFLIGNATLNAIAVTNGITVADVAASSLMRSDSNKKLSAVTIGGGLTFDGTTLSSTSDNWLDSGTTNAFLIGNATVSQITSTNGFLSGLASFGPIGASMYNPGGIASVVNNSITRLSSVKIQGGTGAESFITLAAGGADRVLINTNGILQAHLGEASDNSTVTNALKVGVGTSATFATAGGTMTVNTTSVGNVGAGEDNLMTYSVPANSLAVAGDYLEIRCSGTFAANANNKTLKAYFGTQVLFFIGPAALNGGDFIITIQIIRTGAATQIANTSWACTVSSPNAIALMTTPTETLANAITFKLTGEATTTGDVTEKTQTVRYYRGQ